MDTAHIAETRPLMHCIITVSHVQYELLPEMPAAQLAGLLPHATKAASSAVQSTALSVAAQPPTPASGTGVGGGSGGGELAPQMPTPHWPGCEKQEGTQVKALPGEQTKMLLGMLLDQVFRQGQMAGSQAVSRLEATFKDERLVRLENDAGMVPLSRLSFKPLQAVHTGIQVSGGTGHEAAWERPKKSSPVL